MCMYCERRKDVRFGWLQPELPVTGNMTEGTTVTVNDYRTAQPELVVRNRQVMDGGIATISIPANFCPACGRPLGTPRFRTFEQPKRRLPKCPVPVNVQDLLQNCIKMPYPKMQVYRNDGGKPVSAIITMTDGGEPVYLNAEPHTIASLKKLIHIRNMEDGAVLWKYAYLTAHLLMSIDPNMLFMVHRIIWDTTPDVAPLVKRPGFDLPVDASGLENMGQAEQFRRLAGLTLETVRRYALQSPFLEDRGYGPELSSDDAVAAWASEQMGNLTWRDPSLTLWT